jgi:hypothetical protein
MSVLDLRLKSSVIVLKHEGVLIWRRDVAVGAPVPRTQIACRIIDSCGSDCGVFDLPLPWALGAVR